MELLAVSKETIRTHVIRYFHDVFHTPIAAFKPGTNVRNAYSYSDRAWSQLANVFNKLSWRARTGRSISNGNRSAGSIPKAGTPSSRIWARRCRSAAISSSPPVPSFRPNMWPSSARSAPSPFAERNEAFRAGPAVTVALDGIKEFGYVPWWIQRIHYEITYGWLYNFLSGRDYELLDTSLTFALDPKGHLGLTLSYRNGKLVETGQDVDLANIALKVSY
jgi:hypothetical protein